MDAPRQPAAGCLRAGWDSGELGVAGFSRRHWLSQDELAQLRDAYLRYPCDLTHPFYTTMWTADQDYRRPLAAFFDEVLGPRLAQLLPGHRLSFVNFAVKRPAPRSAIGLHQDWSFVDETRHQSWMVWCPLCDVDETNGCLRVVPRSHRVANNLRPNAADGYEQSPFRELFSVLDAEYVQPLPMSAGEALVFHPALLHGSGDSAGTEDRVALVCVAVPTEAPILHCFRVNDEEVEVFLASDDFYRYDVRPGQRPENLPSLGRVSSSAKPVSRAEFDAVVRGS